MVTEILLGITALGLLKRKPKIGLLPGTRIRKGDLKRLIKSGAKGSVNNDDVLFSDGFLVQMTPNKNGDYPTATPKERDYYKEIINKTYLISPPLKIHFQQAIFPLPTNTKEYLV